MAEIKNCRVVGFTADRDVVSNHRGPIGFTAGTVTLEIILPPGMDRLLPPGFAERKITITIEPTPGEAAYLKHQEPRGAIATSWESISPPEREHWERVARAAIQAK